MRNSKNRKNLLGSRLFVGGLLGGLLLAPWIFACALLDVAVVYFPGMWKVDHWIGTSLTISVACAVAALVLTLCSRWHWSVKGTLVILICALTLGFTLSVLEEFASCSIEVPETINRHGPRKEHCS